MNTTEDLITIGCPAVAPQVINNIVKPIKFPAQPQEGKIVSLRECPTPENMQQCETPDQAAEADDDFYIAQGFLRRRRGGRLSGAQEVWQCASTKDVPGRGKNYQPFTGAVT